MTYRIEISVPPGDSWVWLPTDRPKRSCLLSALRGKDNGKDSDRDRTGWATATARGLLGPQAGPEVLESYAGVLAGLATSARERGAKLACAWMRDSGWPVAQIAVSTFHVSRGQPTPTLDALEKLFARRDAKTAELDVSRVDLPAGPAVRLRREWHDGDGDGGDSPEDTAVSVTYVCRPPQIKDAVVYTMYWVLVDDDPLFTEIADSHSGTLRITT